MSVGRFLAACSLLLLAGCGSSPKTDYFTLSAVPGSERRASSVGPVTVAAVTLPPALDRREMVRQTGDNTVEISGRNRWAAPLGEMARDVLSEDLAERLRQGEVVLPDAPAPPHTGRVAVSLARFGADAGGEIVMKGSWSLLDGHDAAPVVRRPIAFAIRPRSGGSAGEAAGMSELLGQLASEIASHLAAPS